jgi:type IV secretion system protein VirB10
VIIIAAFLLLAAGVSVYYIPSIIRAMSSGDEKPASNAVSTGSVKRATGLSDDVDPFNTRAEPAKTEERKESSDKAEMPTEKVQQNFSRALDVAYGGSSSASSGSVGVLHRPAIQGTRRTAVTNRPRFSLLTQGNPRSFQKLHAFLMTLTFSFLKIPRLSARWTDDLSLIWLASWSVRLMRTYTVQTGM